MAKPVRNLLLILLLAMTALAVPLPRIGRIAESVADLGHPPTFAVLTAGVLAILRGRIASRWSRGAIAAVLVAAFGLVSEITQGWLGRNASIHDLLADLCGIGAALSLWGASAAGTPWSVAARRLGAVGFLSAGFFQPCTVFLDELLAKNELPVLASFEHPWQVSRWFFHGSTAERTHLHATAGNYALRVVLRPGEWLGPSLTMSGGCRDWSKYDRLELDIFVGEDQPLEVWFKAFDEHQNGCGSDRYEVPLVLPPGHTHFVVTIDELRHAPADRQMDVRDMKRFQLYVVKLETPRTLFIDNLRFY